MRNQRFRLTSEIPLQVIDVDLLHRLRNYLHRKGFAYVETAYVATPFVVIAYEEIHFSGFACVVIRNAVPVVVILAYEVVRVAFGYYVNVPYSAKVDFDVRSSDPARYFVEARFAPGYYLQTCLCDYVRFVAAFHFVESCCARSLVVEGLSSDSC
jgi:hypothetical protein